MESNLLEEKKNNYIMCVYKNGIYYGLAVCDLTTGDFKMAQIKEQNNFATLMDEISRYSPAEIVVNLMMYESSEEIGKIRERFGVYISKLEDENFEQEVQIFGAEYEVIDENEQKIEDLQENLFCVAASNGLLNYLRQTQKNNLEYIRKIHIYKTTHYMNLDISARRNLEITEKLRDKSKKGTLLWVLDKTSTSMGGRLLRRWLNDPLIDIFKINERLEAVKQLKEDIILRGDVIDSLKKVYDIERLAGKISYGSANARDLISLKNSVKQLPDVKKTLEKAKAPLLTKLYEELDILEDIYEIIDNSIIDDPPISIKEGGIIKLGYNEEIDHLKKATTDGKSWVLEIEAKEREATRNKSIKNRI